MLMEMWAKSFALEGYGEICNAFQYDIAKIELRARLPF